MTNRMSTVDTKKVIPVCSSSVLKNSTTVNTKIVLVGDCECGKTALIRRYMQSNFTEVSEGVTFCHNISNKFEGKLYRFAWLPQKYTTIGYL